MMPALGYAFASLPAPIGPLPLLAIDAGAGLEPLGWALAVALAAGVAAVLAFRRSERRTSVPQVRRIVVVSKQLAA